jgi:hypothetical protein
MVTRSWLRSSFQVPETIAHVRKSMGNGRNLCSQFVVHARKLIRMAIPWVAVVLVGRATEFSFAAATVDPGESKGGWAPVLDNLWSCLLLQGLIIIIIVSADSAVYKTLVKGQSVFATHFARGEAAPSSTLLSYRLRHLYAERVTSTARNGLSVTMAMGWAEVLALFIEHYTMDHTAITIIWTIIAIVFLWVAIVSAVRAQGRLDKLRLKDRDHRMRAEFGR